MAKKALVPSPKSTKLNDGPLEMVFTALADQAVEFSSSMPPGLYKSDLNIPKDQHSTMLIYEDGHCVVNHPKIGVLVTVGFDHDNEMGYFQLDDEMLKLLGQGKPTIYNFVVKGELRGWLKSLEQVDDGQNTVVYTSPVSPKTTTKWYSPPAYTIGSIGLGPGYTADPDLEPLVNKLTKEYEAMPPNPNLLDGLQPTMPTYKNPDIKIYNNGEYGHTHTVFM